MPATPENLTQEQHIERVTRMLAERRKKVVPVAVERRGVNPQRRGFEEWADVDTAFVADRHLDEKDD